jgi:hypothetical protein
MIWPDTDTDILSPGCCKALTRFDKGLQRVIERYGDITPAMAYEGEPRSIGLQWASHPPGSCRIEHAGEGQRRCARPEDMHFSLLWTCRRPPMLASELRAINARVFQSLPERHL